MHDALCLEHWKSPTNKGMKTNQLASKKIFFSWSKTKLNCPSLFHFVSFWTFSRSHLWFSSLQLISSPFLANTDCFLTIPTHRFCARPSVTSETKSRVAILSHSQHPTTKQGLLFRHISEFHLCIVTVYSDHCGKIQNTQCAQHWAWTEWCSENYPKRQSRNNGNAYDHKRRFFAVRCFRMLMHESRVEDAQPEHNWTRVVLYGNLLRRRCCFTVNPPGQLHSAPLHFTTGWSWSFSPLNVLTTKSDILRPGKHNCTPQGLQMRSHVT